MERNNQTDYRLKREKKYRIAADSALFLVAMIWGGGFIAAKAALAERSAVYILAFRFLGAALLMGILFFKKIRSAGRTTVICGCLVGAMHFVGQSVQLLGLERTTAGKQAFIIASYVVFVPFLSWLLFHNKPTKSVIFAGVIVLIGISLISLNGDLHVQSGDVLSLLFACIFALQIVLTGKFVKNVEVLPMTFYQFLTAGFLAFVVTLFTGAGKESMSSGAVGGILYLIVLNTVVAFTIQNIAQKYTSDSHAAILISLESVFGLLLSVWIYREPVSFKMLAGCILVFCAVILCIKKE